MTSKLPKIALPGEPLWPPPPEIEAWRVKRAGNQARRAPAGTIILCTPDGVHRNYPTLTAACAAAVWVR